MVYCLLSMMWASGFVSLYNAFVYDMYAPVVIQDKTYNILVINISKTKSRWSTIYIHLKAKDGSNEFGRKIKNWPSLYTQSFSAWNAKDRTNLSIIIEWKITTNLYVHVIFLLKSVLGAHLVNVRLWAGKMNASSACTVSSYCQSSSAYL